MSQLTDLFTNIANAIREKGGTSEQIAASAFAEQILSLPAGANITIEEVTTSGSAKSIVVPSGIGKDFCVILRTEQYTPGTFTLLFCTNIGNTNGVGGYRCYTSLPATSIVGQLVSKFTSSDGMKWDKTTGTMTVHLDAGSGAESMFKAGTYVCFLI